MDIETANNVKLDDEFKLQIFKEGFLEGEQDVYYEDYRLSKDKETEIEWEHDGPLSSIPTVKISSLPITDQDSNEFIEAANRSFDRIMERIEPNNPELTRSLWDANEQDRNLSGNAKKNVLIAKKSSKTGKPKNKESIGKTVSF